MRSEKIGKHLFFFFVLFCLTLPMFAGSAALQPMAITDVVNAASRLGTGLPGSGIAQGALFAVTGVSVGPSQAVQGTFPLTTDAGLGGVTISVSAGGSTAFAIMVYVSLNEVDAILPSSTALGPATVTVNNNGTTATAPMTVVASAFGIFTSFYGGFGPALVFNVNADGSTTQNSNAQSATNGQTVMMNGTGLGAITSDETQSGVTDTPNVNITIWVGSQQVQPTSAGRGFCCAGLDPTYPIPPGIAAWDVITFTIPDGVAGCQISVAVQIGNTVSNIGQMAVGPNGGTCPELNLLNLGDATLLPNPYKSGLITIGRVMTSSNAGGASLMSTSDNADAVFYQITLPTTTQLRIYDLLYASYLKATAGTCQVTLFRALLHPPPSNTPLPPSNPPVPLDAGPKLTVVNPKESQDMLPDKNKLYSANKTLTAISIAGAPPITSGGPLFNEPGAWNLNNGSGGADIGGFNVPLTNPQPVTVTNLAQLTSITRGQDLPLAWTGGDANGYMEISGAATSITATFILSGSWYCLVNTGDGHFTVPGYVTAGLPQVLTPLSASGQGSITFTPIIIQFVNIPGVDVTNYISTWSVGQQVSYQ